MIDLGTLSGDCGSYPIAINDAGDVVGYSVPSWGSPIGSRLFLYRDGTMTALSFGGQGGSWFRAWNEAGDIVGQSDTAEGIWRPFLYHAGTMIELSFYPSAINNAGDVVGIAEMPPPEDPSSPQEYYAVLYRDGVTTDLGTLGGWWSWPALNNSGDVIGCWAGGGFVCWNGGSMTDLGAFRPAAINEAGDIMGTLGSYGAVRYRDTGLITTLDLGVEGSQAIAMNQAGDVIGSAGWYQAFVYYRNGEIINLGTVGGWPSCFSMALNEAGDIIGSSSTAGNAGHAFLFLAVNTPQGPYVVVEPAPSVTMTFDEVTTAGRTTVAMSYSGPTPPSVPRSIISLLR